MKRMDMAGEVRRFVLTSVPSVPYLEAVLLLRAQPGDTWNAQSISRRLYLPEQQGAELLRALAAAGIAQSTPPQPGSFHYGPASPELAAMLDKVAQVYAADLVGVTDLIHSRVDKRAQQFADAFRWRKDF